MITIYTDGAARGNPGPGGWGAVVADASRVMELGGDEAHTTNNRMELTAAIEAIKFASENCAPDEPIILYTDSEYLMKGITVWINDWQKNNWRTAAKKPVMNKPLWQELLIVTEEKEIEWKYVAGHSGHVANDRCDEIATAFADGTSIELYDGPRNSYRYF